MKKFLYTSETPCHTSIFIKGEAVHFSLYKNEVYELPEKDSFVITLIAQKKLSIQNKIK